MVGRWLRALNAPVFACGISVHILVVMLLDSALDPLREPFWRGVDATLAIAFLVDYWTVWRKRLK